MDTKFNLLIVTSVFLLLSGCDEINIIRVQDVSKRNDVSYQYCATQRFVINSRQLKEYLANSRVVTPESWTELDHFPCQKKFTYTDKGLMTEIQINLSGAAQLTRDDKKIFLNCDLSCKRISGWDHPQP